MMTKAHSENVAGKKLSILIVSTGLNTGGAERMLVKILTHIDRTRFSPYVVSLIDKGTMGAAIEHLGIPVTALNINTKAGLLLAPWRLARLIRKKNFSLIQGWMYHGNLLAWLGRLLAGSRAALSFGIRHSLYDLNREHLNTRCVIRANALLSSRIDSSLFNSSLSLDRHRSFGFKSPLMSVIPNGFELDSFVPNRESARALRTKLGLTDALVVGLIARFDPAKDHRNFLAAAAKVIAIMPDVRFVLVGRQITPENSELMAWVQEFGLVEAVLLLGERTDIPVLNNMFDVACLSSYMEAFPNVVGEAMACGTPCAVTNVGDCEAIIGDTGRVVQPENADVLAMAILDLLHMSYKERHELGERARQRMCAGFDIAVVTNSYMSHFDAVVCRH